MNKQSFHKREVALIIITSLSILGLIASVLYIVNLQRDMSDVKRTYSASLTTQGNELREQIGYTDTVCAEYRKLYGAYEGLSMRVQSANESGYTLPGSAKGEVDECYQPE